jgi:SsrA-binding protein
MAKQRNISIVNRKAKFEFKFINEFEAGIMLTGTEVKSIKEGKANLSDAYCTFKNGELFIRNLHISEYKQGSYNNHEPKRERKLLLNRHELKKLERRVSEKGMTIVPYKVYFSERGLIKIQVILSEGKKAYDKRKSIKDKDMKREMDRRYHE